MALLYVSLGAVAQMAGTPAAPLYTNPAATKTYVNAIRLHNSEAVSHMLYLYEVPGVAGSPGTATAAMRILKYTLAPDQTFVDRFEGDGIVLENEGDSIQGYADVASKVNVKFLGAKDA